MKKMTKIMNKALAVLLAVLMLASVTPVQALTGDAQITQTPFVQFCGAYINLSGTNYLCAVDLGAPQVDSASDTVLTPGTTVRLDLFFNINDAWYACRKQEMQGDPNDIFTVRFIKTAGGDRVTDPVWKTYPDDGYGERWYLEFSVIGGDVDAPIDLSVALTQPDVPNVGADYRITGTSAGYATCAADFVLPGYTGPCDIYLGDPLTSTGDPAAMTPGATVYFPLMFMGGDGQLYAAYSTELRGNPSDLFTVEEKGTGFTKISWKTWDNGHWYLEYTVDTADPGATLGMQVRLRQVPVYKATPWKSFAGAVAQKGVCTAPISIGGTVYDCTVDLQSYLTSTGDPQNMTANSTVCFPLMFMGGDGQWYPVLSTELQGDPSDLFTVSETITSGGALLTCIGWKTWENGHYYLEYIVADSQYETPLELSVQLKQDAAWRQGNVDSFSGKAPASTNPIWRQCVAPISVGGTVYDCIVDLQGYLTSSGSDTLTGGGTVCFPLMFMGGDGQWYPVLKDELQGDPAVLFSTEETIVSGAEVLSCTGWKTWENGHYYREYKAEESETEMALDFSVKLTQIAAGKYGDAVAFAGTVPAKQIYCSVPIQLDGMVYQCRTDFGTPVTSSGTDVLSGGGTVAFPLMFLGGDGVWYPVLKNELQGDPAQLLTVSKSVSSGSKLLSFQGWKYWDNGHYYAEFAVANAQKRTNVRFQVQLKQSGKAGSKVTFSGIVPGSGTEVGTPDRCVVPIKIDGKVYDCFVDLQGYLTSSGTETLSGGGTVAFPLMFQGGDDAWYPVLKDELQGDPAQLFGTAQTILSGGELLKCTGWKCWEGGHYYLEYAVADPAERQNVEFSVALTCKGAKGAENKFLGYAVPGPKISELQIPLKKSASLIIERLEECADFITMSFTIADVRYDDPWPIDFESPNTTSAVITDGTIIRSDLCFMVNNQWYPVRQQECNFSVEELVTYEFEVLEGDDFLGIPRFTTRYDAYGDIWQFEVAVNSEEEGDFCFTLQLVSKDGTKSGSKYKVTGRVQNGQMSSTVEELPPETDIPWLWIGVGAGALVLVLLVVLILDRKKKAEK